MLMLLITIVVKNYRLFIVPNSVVSALQTYFSPHHDPKRLHHYYPRSSGEEPEAQRGENSRLQS